MINSFKEKLFESFKSVLPIVVIIMIICSFIAPIDSSIFLLFLTGAILLIIGMSLFSNGADLSMITIGSKMGVKLFQSKKIWLICLVSLIMGIFITFTEPDVQILAEQVSDVPNLVLIVSVATGVGVFLVIAMLKVIFNIRLSIILIIFYSVIFILSFFVPKTFLSIAFDSGGVTTGPMTVPFLISFGMGVTSITNSKKTSDDQFGTIAICSIGPIIAVMVLGIFYNVTELNYTYVGSFDIAGSINNSKEMYGMFGEGLLKYLVEVGKSLIPIIVFYVVFQVLTRSFSKIQNIRIIVGLFLSYIGLVLFLTGANSGFLPLGYSLGETLATIHNGYILIPIGVIFGYFIVKAEPSVYILTKQVEKVSLGAVSSRKMNNALGIGVGVAIGLSILRILFDINILWILIPGYLIALILTFFVPRMFTGIAFDSGGVASGAMASSFILPMIIGACYTLESNILTQAFGCISFIALAPLVSIQISGLIYAKKAKKAFGNIEFEDDTIINYM